VASQPDKVKLLFNEGHKKSLAAPFKTQHMEVKRDSDDPDRRLAKDGSIRGGKTEDSAKRKRQLQDWNTAFEANVAMPVRLKSMMKKTSGDPNRRLQTPECTEQDNGLLACVQDGYPWEGAAVVFLDCPVSATSVLECQSCGILATADDTLPECNAPSVPTLWHMIAPIFLKGNVSLRIVMEIAIRLILVLIRLILVLIRLILVLIRMILVLIRMILVLIRLFPRRLRLPTRRSLQPRLLP
jgi:hypothetical protein